MQNKFFKKINISLLSLLLMAFMFSLFTPLALAQDSAKVKEPSYCKEKVKCDLKSQDALGKPLYEFIEAGKPGAELCTKGKGRCVAKSNVKLNVSIPRIGKSNLESVTNIDDYISTMFDWLLKLGGVIAAMVIVWGGYIYITAAGNQAKVGQAKETITGGLVGLVLLFGSVTLLGFLNNRLIVSAPIYVDSVDAEPFNGGFCNTEKTPNNQPAPSADKAITCGNIVKGNNGGECISDYCGGPDLYCVPKALKIGLGLSGNSKNDYICIKGTIDNIEEACTESEGIADFNQCGYISDILGKVGSSNKCGFGIILENDVIEDPSSINNINICYLGDLLPAEHSVKRLSCSSCGLTTDAKDWLRGEREGDFFEKRYNRNIITGHYITKKIWRLFCAEPGVDQVEWYDDIAKIAILDNDDSLVHAGAVCEKTSVSDATPRIRIGAF